MLAVAIILILWMVYHRNDKYYEIKQEQKIKAEAIKDYATPIQVVEKKRANCGALTPLERIIWAYNEQPQALITPNTRAIMICNPGNPTGYLYKPSELEALRDLVIKHDLYLIADEVYREFAYDDNFHQSILNLEGLEENAIVIDYNHQHL